MTQKNKVLMSGNEAIARGAIDAGCVFYAGYPITPQNELIAYMGEHLPDTGGIFIQAESELAAINMVFGASAAGVRAMTSSSSPGISLKQEGISYLAGAELPSVIVNVMRGGPGLGSISPSQADYFQATRGGGHGDYYCLVLAPATVQEAYDFMRQAFELSDKYRIPAMILCDGMLGQMMEPIITTKRKNKIYSKPWALTGCKGRAPNVVKTLCMVEGDLEKLNLSLQKKYKEIFAKEQVAESFLLEDALVVLVGYGTMARIAKAAVRRLRAEGIKAGLICPKTLWPFPKDTLESLARKAKKGTIVLAVEMSYGQMVEDVRLSVNGKLPVEFIGRSGGEMPGEDDIVMTVRSLVKKSRRC